MKLSSIKGEERRAAALDLRKRGATYKQIRIHFGVGQVVVRRICLQAQSREIHPDRYVLSGRAWNYLRNMNIDPLCLDQIALLKERELLEQPNFGKFTLNEIKIFLCLHGRVLTD